MEGETFHLQTIIVEIVFVWIIFNLFIYLNLILEIHHFYAIKVKSMHTYIHIYVYGVELQ